MQVFYWNEIFDSLNKGLKLNGFENGCGISIGSFDGLHQGHRLLISTLVNHCKSERLLSGVISFTRPLPSYKNTSSYQGDLTTLSQRLALFKTAGVDFAIIVDFTKEFSELSGEHFLSLLQNSLNLKFIAEGVDFKCGYKGATDIVAIKNFTDKNNIKYEFLEPVYYRTENSFVERISSSYIRENVQKGLFSLAQQLLQRPYSLELNFTTEELEIPLSQIKQVLPLSQNFYGKVQGEKVQLQIFDKKLKLKLLSSSANIPLNQNIEVVL